MPAVLKKCNGKKKCFQDGVYTYSELCGRNFVFTTITGITLSVGSSILVTDNNGIVVYQFSNFTNHDYEVSVCIRVGRMTVITISSS
jgi:hypothetical protein